MAEPRWLVYRIGKQGTERWEDDGEELARVGARLVELGFLETEEQVIAAARDADGLIVQRAPIRKRVLDALPKLKFIMRTGVGYDNFDVAEATKHGVAVLNVPDLWTREVANHAMAMLLALNRKLFSLDRKVRDGGWVPAVPPFDMGAIHGETLGIVGLGRIGRALARRAAAFEMRILACDPYIDRAIFKEYNATPMALHDILAQSDYVSIHVPLTQETYHMFGEQQFRTMKRTAFLINTARGPVVDLAAVTKALEEKLIAGAGLDVIEKEPPPPDHPILKLDNVILAPHVGYFSTAAVASLPRRCGEDAARVLSGRMPHSLVNPEVRERLKLRDE